MRDAPRPPPLPQHALIWLVVAAPGLVLVLTAGRGAAAPDLPLEGQTTRT
jgi:hypothetical protein